MKRNSKGQFVPAIVAKGDYICTGFHSFNPGFTPEKFYPVLATKRSLDVYELGGMSGRRAYELTEEHHCIVQDDDGDYRFINLRNKQLKSGDFFPTWEVVKKSQMKQAKAIK